jgi:hypothetical protein
VAVAQRLFPAVLRTAHCRAERSIERDNGDSFALAICSCRSSSTDGIKDLGNQAICAMVSRIAPVDQDQTIEPHWCEHVARHKAIVDPVQAAQIYQAST